MYDLYPVTIVANRYGGIYEGGLFGAFPVDAIAIPFASYGIDIDCLEWWSAYGDLVGIGNTPDSALQDLHSKLVGIILATSIENTLRILDGVYGASHIGRFGLTGMMFRYES